MRAGLRVPLRLEPLERLDQIVGRQDRVRAADRLADMDRPALDMDPEPDDAGIGTDQHLLLGFWDDGGISAITSNQAGKRAVAGAFLFGHGLEMDRGGG